MRFRQVCGGLPDIVAANHGAIVETVHAPSLRAQHTFDPQIVGANNYSPLPAIAIHLFVFA